MYAEAYDDGERMVYGIMPYLNQKRSDTFGPGIAHASFQFPPVGVRIKVEPSDNVLIIPMPFTAKPMMDGISEVWNG